MDVYANDRRVLQGLEVRAGSDDVAADFGVEVTDGRLVLVFHAPARRIFERGRKSEWRFGGLEIEALEPGSGGDTADDTLALFTVAHFPISPTAGSARS